MITKFSHPRAWLSTSLYRFISEYIAWLAQVLLKYYPIVTLMAFRENDVITNCDDISRERPKTIFSENSSSTRLKKQDSPGIFSLVFCMQLTIIQKRIYEIRGFKVMLDRDLAELFGTETRILKQAVKRNIDRFPGDFMFKLTAREVKAMVSQNVIPSKSYFGGASPFAFTEHGVTMLANVLKSKKAIQMSIAIVRAFIALKQLAVNYKDLAEQINEIRQTVSSHSEQLKGIYNVIENMLDDKVEQKAWKERERIGFKK